MKFALVVGASGGIGSELVKKLKLEGYAVIGSGKSESTVFGETYIQIDLTKTNDINDLVTKVGQQVKQLDLLVYTAGVANYLTLSDSTDDTWDETMGVNAKAPYLLVNKLRSLLEKAPNPLAIFIGSGAGVIPMKGRSIYCASKFALRGLILSLAEEYMGKKPQFCLITLGSTLTNFGDKTIEQKRKEFEAGRAYFPVEYVVNKLVEIINNPKRETEIVLYPGDHGFGTWNKP